jgi:hypothetical protein
MLALGGILINTLHCQGSTRITALQVAEISYITWAYSSLKDCNYSTHSPDIQTSADSERMRCYKHIKKMIYKMKGDILKKLNSHTYFEHTG